MLVRRAATASLRLMPVYVGLASDCRHLCADYTPQRSLCNHQPFASACPSGVCRETQPKVIEDASRYLTPSTPINLYSRSPAMWAGCMETRWLDAWRHVGRK